MGRKSSETTEIGASADEPRAGGEPANDYGFIVGSHWGPEEAVSPSPNPAPQYIAEAGIPSEEAWEREKELYREKYGDETGRSDT